MRPDVYGLPTGTVYGPLLNFRRERDLWAPRMSDAPYKAAPQAPVLYVKTANTFAAAGAAVAVPEPVWLGPTLGLVVGSSVSNWTQAPSGQAQAAIETIVLGGVSIAACMLLSDLALPHESYYRPAIRFRNRDGFLVCGASRPPLAPAALAALTIEARLNGEAVLRADLSTLVRDAAALLADVSAFMTLQPGDVLMLGTECLADGTRPLGRAGDRIEVRAPGFEPLVHTLTQEVA
ncbi:MAG: fumarylacetoacetate hydrolase family protein [Burkholderiales bacterium]|nr:fumarylacetoacetate hydrolase family protein [Burkholderiales bacterium]